ncbi:hypothetical protein D917_04187 [Trichinella nativa]|uniref:Uncharacterized protein n=1 Tax=Trichinella nativa TaxID=6335 RepID=A0A1Y3EAX7_9BILA|nr:hypothetical protein D917_04187 [Trichinella nativa]
MNERSFCGRQQQQHKTINKKNMLFGWLTGNCWIDNVKKKQQQQQAAVEKSRLYFYLSDMDDGKKKKKKHTLHFLRN